MGLGESRNCLATRGNIRGKHHFKVAIVWFNLSIAETWRLCCTAAYPRISRDMQVLRRGPARPHFTPLCIVSRLATRVNSRPGLQIRASSSHSSQPGSSGNKSLLRTIGLIAGTMTVTFLGTKWWDSRSAAEPHAQIAKTTQYADKKTMLVVSVFMSFYSGILTDPFIRSDSGSRQDTQFTRR